MKKAIFVILFLSVCTLMYSHLNADQKSKKIDVFYKAMRRLTPSFTNPAHPHSDTHLSEGSSHQKHDELYTAWRRSHSDVGSAPHYTDAEQKMAQDTFKRGRYCHNKLSDIYLRMNRTALPSIKDRTLNNLQEKNFQQFLTNGQQQTVLYIIKKIKAIQLRMKNLHTIQSDFEHNLEIERIEIKITKIKRIIQKLMRAIRLELDIFLNLGSSPPLDESFAHPKNSFDKSFYKEAFEGFETFDDSSD